MTEREREKLAAALDGLPQEHKAAAVAYAVNKHKVNLEHVYDAVDTLEQSGDTMINALKDQADSEANNA